MTLLILASPRGRPRKSIRFSQPPTAPPHHDDSSSTPMNCRKTDISDARLFNELFGSEPEAVWLDGNLPVNSS